MREIKFRVHVKTNNNFYSEEEIEFMNNQIHEVKVADFIHGQVVIRYNETVITIFDNYCKYTLLQFTGLKDKNGKEIYEGDWIHSAPGYCSKVEFKDGAFLSIYSHPEDGEELLLTDLNLKTAEVIGNIYENHELV